MVNQILRVSIMSNKIGSQEKGLSQAEMSVVTSDFNIAGSDTSASALSVSSPLHPPPQKTNADIKAGDYLPPPHKPV
jgi:hypothetical protein